MTVVVDGCNVAPAITFDYDRWRIEFPELSGISSDSIYSVDVNGLPYGYWPTASIYVRNVLGRVRCPANLAEILYHATAHIASIQSARTNDVPTTGGAEPPTALVGRITSATEGSVSVSAEMPGQSPAAAWWQQTPYGAKVWEMLRPHRTFRYIPAPRRLYNPPWWRGGFGPGY